MKLERDDEGRLTLVADGMRLCGDFTRMLPRLRHNRLGQELLVRAARIRGVAGTPIAVDATAGLGEDSLLLAAAGFSVTMMEQDPLIAALLQDALDRARLVPELAAVASRMCLREGNSVELLSQLGDAPDVVYLDPMFPARHKDAATKKKLQLLRQLESPTSPQDEEALVKAALAARPRKVVIKRPLKGPYLAGVKPSHSLSGKLIRYDCLVVSVRP